MYDKLKELGVNNPQGWIRIWIVTSVVWLVSIGGYDALEWHSQNEVIEMNKSFCAKEFAKPASVSKSFGYYSKCYDSSPYVSQYERNIIKLKKIGASIVRYFGPPIAIPALVISVLVVGRWVVRGFHQ